MFLHLSEFSEDFWLVLWPDSCALDVGFRDISGMFAFVSLIMRVPGGEGDQRGACRRSQDTKKGLLIKLPEHGRLMLELECEKDASSWLSNNCTSHQRVWLSAEFL